MKVGGPLTGYVVERKRENDEQTTTTTTTTSTTTTTTTKMERKNGSFFVREGIVNYVTGYGEVTGGTCD